MAPIDYLLKWINQDDLQSVLKIGDAFSEIVKGRYASLVGSALIDRCALLSDSGKSERALHWLAFAKKIKFPFEQPLESGQTFSTAAVARSMKLAQILIQSGLLSAQVPNKAGHTSMEVLIQNASKPSALSVATEMVRSVDFDPKLNQAGALLAFNLYRFLPFKSLKQEHIDGVISLLVSLKDKGFDFNTPMHTPDLGDVDVPVHTPLAYFIKRLAKMDDVQYVLHQKDTRKLLGQIIDELMNFGADPALQMEKDQKVVLIEISKKYFEPGVSNRIEAQILFNFIEKEQPAQVVQAAPVLRRL